MTRIAAPAESLALNAMLAVDSPLARDARREPPAPRLPVERISDGELIRSPALEHSAFERLRVASTYDADNEPVAEIALLSTAGDRRGTLARYYADSITATGEKIGLIVNTYV
jgi:hypothetical protein